jgi:outer membrane protein, heavy metal efflux system
MKRVLPLPVLFVLTSPGAGQVPPGQPPPVRPHTLTLTAAIEEALAFDPTVQADNEGLRQAEAEVVTASRPPNPTLTVSGTLLPLGTSFTPQTQGGPPQLDVGLSYPLDWFLFGKRGAAVAAARVAVDEARSGHRDFVRRKKADVAAAFFDVLEARELAALARQDVLDMDRIQSIAEQRVAIGGAAPVEADRILVATLEARREQRRREAAFRTARSALAAIIGRTGTDGEFDVDGGLEVTGTPAAADALALLADAENARPDIAARRRAVERATADVHLARRTGWPELTPRVGYTRQYQETVGFPDVSSYGVGLDLTLPLFDRNQGSVSRAISVQTQRQLELRGALIALRAEMDQLASDYAVARETVVTEDRAQLEAARRVRERVRGAYELGGRPLLEVLDAERIHREASRQSTSGRAAFWRAAYRLNAAVGREVVP